MGTFHGKWNGKANLDILESIARNVDQKGQEVLGRRRERPRRKAVKKVKASSVLRQGEIPWVDRFVPESLAQHFVHKNKVLQFRTWLTTKFSRGSKICLLTGGAGVGKTATVRLVAAELGYEVKEWVNPMSLTQYQEAGDWKYSEGDIQGRSQIDAFSDFLRRASQYGSLRIKGRAAPKKSLILVEDFPNFFYKDVNTLHQIMKYIGESPLVFVITNSASPDCSSYKLFPKSILMESAAEEIALNPVAASFMTKFANSVLAQANAEMNSELLSEIVAASAGDMRSCINNIQFRFQNSGSSVPMFRPITRTKHWYKSGQVVKRQRITKDESTPTHTRKDDSLFLFHAIGKVLYSKRDGTIESNIENEQLKGHCDSAIRIHPLKECPQEINAKIAVAPETFFNFLHQNYLSFFTSMDNIAKASSYLADSETIFSCQDLDNLAGNTSCYRDWEVREEFGLTVAIRGLMFANQYPPSGGWRPLQKPNRRDNAHKVTEMIKKTAEHMPCPINRDYYTDLIPFAAKIRPGEFTQEKLVFLNEYGRFITKGKPYKLLDEDDAAGTEESDSETVENCPVNEPRNVVNAAVPNLPGEFEDYIIEDVMSD